MPAITSTANVTDPWEVPRSVLYTSAYLKRLLIERHSIRARLENPGGSVILGATKKLETEQMEDYSAVIGNTAHLDLLDAERVVNTLPKDERYRLLMWVDGLSPSTAAEYASVKPGTVRTRGSRVAKKVTESMNEPVRPMAAKGSSTTVIRRVV